MISGILIPIVALLIPIVAIAAVTFIIVTIIRALSGRADRARLSGEERAQLELIMQAMQKMEDRVSNLETILMQTTGRKGPQDGRQ